MVTVRVRETANILQRAVRLYLPTRPHRDMQVGSDRSCLAVWNVCRLHVMVLDVQSDGPPEDGRASRGGWFGRANNWSALC